MRNQLLTLGVSLIILFLDSHHIRTVDKPVER